MPDTITSSRPGRWRLACPNRRRGPGRPRLDRPRNCKGSTQHFVSLNRAVAAWNQMQVGGSPDLGRLGMSGKRCRCGLLLPCSLCLTEAYVATGHMGESQIDSLPDEGKRKARR